MRNLNLEAAIWYLFTSPKFFETAAQECEDTMSWFGTLAISRKVPNFGRNNQIFDTIKALARNFRRGAELAKLGDYRLVWDTARCIGGDVRGMFEQPLHGWMSQAEYHEFDNVRMSRILLYAGKIERALENAMVKGESFFHPNPDCPERSQDDDGFPGDEITGIYSAYIDRLEGLPSPRISDQRTEYMIDKSIACKTGDEVPWTGVWYPATGLERHSLTFAIKGLRMQPAFRVVKSIEELEAENDGEMFFSPQTIAVATTWHPLIPSDRCAEPDQELRAKAGESCPKPGIWESTDERSVRRTYHDGETMANLGSAYGLTVWRWVADR